LDEVAIGCELRWQRSGVAEQAIQRRTRVRRKVNRDENGGGKIRREMPGQEHQGFDSAGGCSERKDVAIAHDRPLR
jgi:hypothetical protein